MNTYYFGDDSVELLKIEAPSLKRAISIFRHTVLMPHTYSNKRIPEEVMGERGYHVKVYRRSEPGATVSIWSLDENGKRQKVEEISPDREDSLLLTEGQESLALSIPSPLGNSGTSLMTLSSIAAEDLSLREQIGKLECLRHELEQKRDALSIELSRRRNQIWMIELFLGTNEYVHCLRSGEKADRSELIVIHQRVLCMDEEIAVWHYINNPEGLVGFDYENIEDFDRWLVSDDRHLDSIMPHKKGIVALRVRREKKRRDQPKSLMEMFHKIEAEQQDEMVYILVRNGHNLYRLWVDINIWPRFFPRFDEWESLVESIGGSGANDSRHLKFRLMDRTSAENKAQHYLAGLVALQGIVERSDLLHPLPAMVGKPNVLDPSQDGILYYCLRNDETENHLGTGADIERVTWRSYSKWLRERISVGCRVIWYGHCDRDYSSVRWRTRCNSVHCAPLYNEIYTLDKEEDGYSDFEWSFLYLPDDHVYSGYESKDRERRIRFRCDSSELWPIDFISLRVVNYLLECRSQRHEYHEFFYVFHLWSKIKNKEREYEKPFIDLVLSRSGYDPNSVDVSTRARAERNLRWWKLKNSTHRSLSTDEPKALRMVTRAFKSGVDYPDDPEINLFS